MIKFEIKTGKETATMNIESDQYAVLREVTNALLSVADANIGYTRPATEAEKILLDQVSEEQNELCECQKKLKQAKYYIARLIVAVSKVNNCNGCCLRENETECRKRIDSVGIERCYKHSLLDEIQAFLKDEKPEGEA